MKIIFTAVAFVVLAAGSAFGQQKAGSLRIFHSKQLRIGFKYPSRWKVTESKDGITLTVPDNAYPQTNFVSAEADFGAGSKESRAHCRDWFLEGIPNTDLHERKVTIGGTTYDMASSAEGPLRSKLREGPAGNTYSETWYSTYQSGKCYSIFLEAEARAFDPKVRQVDIDNIFWEVIRSLRVGK